MAETLSVLSSTNLPYIYSISKYTNVVCGLKSSSTIKSIFNRQDKWLSFVVKNLLLKESTNVKAKKNNMGFKITTKSSMIIFSFNYNIFKIREVDAIVKPHSFFFFGGL
jgi:hypothetical protein